VLPYINIQGGEKSMGIVQGHVFGFWMFIVLAAASLWVINASKNDKYNVKLRAIAGLEAIEESVGRATEMGKPVHFTPGLGDIVATNAAETFAAMEILAYVTNLAAKYNAQLVVTIRQPNVFPLAQESVRQGFLAAGKPDMYREDTVRFISNNQDAYTSGVVGFLHREQAAANIMAGLFMGESLLLAEAGAQIGAMQVAITASTTQLPFFVAACDYTIIGEELFASGAYLSNDKVKLGAIAAQDYFKLAVMATIILGTILTTAGSRFVQELLVK
jgi:hypothetical protein